MLLSVVAGLTTVLLAAPVPRSERVARNHSAASCVDLALVDATPAKLEWSYWASGGILVNSSGANAGLGGELTFGIAQYRGFPSGPYGRAARAELRAGPWAAASTWRGGGLVEAGLKLQLGAVYHASWGTYDLRVGSGYGAFSEGRAQHASVVFAWGVRSVPSRYTQRSFCAPAPSPRAVAEASVARIFLAYRRTFDGVSNQVLVGIELSPTFLFPPYGGSRLSGGPAW